MICAALLALGSSALAQDVSRGALLYEAHCAACHREGLHERGDFLDASHYRLDLQRPDKAR